MSGVRIPLPPFSHREKRHNSNRSMGGLPPLDVGCDSFYAVIQFSKLCIVSYRSALFQSSRSFVLPSPLRRPILPASRNMARGDLIWPAPIPQPSPATISSDYANGTWIDKTQIPPDKPAYSLRLAMTDLTEQRLHEMMESFATRAKGDPDHTRGKSGRLLSLIHGRGAR